VTTAAQLLELATQAFAAGEDAEASDIKSRLMDNLQLLQTAPVDPVDRKLMGKIVADVLVAESMHWIGPEVSQKMQDLIDEILGE
jgi:hypothetical protein